MEESDETLCRHDLEAMAVTALESVETTGTLRGGKVFETGCLV